MDLELWPLGETARLLPRSVHGMLWLQQQFEPCAWELICEGNVRLTSASCHRLLQEAQEAGLTVAELPINHSAPQV